MDLSIKDNNRTIENLTLAIRRIHSDGKKISAINIKKETGLTNEDIDTYMLDIIQIIDALGYE